MIQHIWVTVAPAVRRIARLATPIQSGNVNLYLLYVFLVVLLAYLLGALGAG